MYQRLLLLPLLLLCFMLCTNSTFWFFSSTPLKSTFSTDSCESRGLQPIPASLLSHFSYLDQPCPLSPLRLAFHSSSVLFRFVDYWIEYFSRFIHGPDDRLIREEFKRLGKTAWRRGIIINAYKFHRFEAFNIGILITLIYVYWW